MSADQHLGPQFGYHGSPDDYPIGHVIDPSKPHQRAWDVSSPSHVYFASDPDDAADWGVQAARRTGRKRTNIYAVKSLGASEPDPLGGYGNYRTTAGLQVLGHAQDFERDEPSDLSDALDSYWRNR